MPKHFWGECALAATHIINKLPTACLNWISPFERLYGKPPTYDDLRVVGCLSFVANLQPSDKLDYRAKRCIFLGYTFGYKGYKLYDLQTRKVFHSRDVIFYENIFPFKKDTYQIGNPDQDVSHPLPTYAASDGSSLLPIPSSDTNIPSRASIAPDPEPNLVVSDSLFPSSSSSDNSSLSTPQASSLPHSSSNLNLSSSHPTDPVGFDTVHSPSPTHGPTLKRPNRARVTPA